MKDILRISLRLAVICAVAAVSLACINLITEPKIAEYNRQLLLKALSEVSGGMSVSADKQVVEDDEFPEIDSYYLLAENGAVNGYILAIIASGYGGPMDLIAGFRSDGALIDARLLKNAETPGLGKEAEKPVYMEKFIGTGGDEPVPVRKSDLSASETDSISGATITFSGIAKALAAGSAFVRTIE